MKKLVLFLILIFGVLMSKAAPKNVSTPNAINTFIKNLEKLSTLSDNQSDKAYGLFETNIKLFDYTENGGGGINIDRSGKKNSEFCYLGLAPLSNARSYCRELYNCIYKKRTLRLSHNVLSTKEIDMPDVNGKDVAYFYDTLIKKTCYYNNKVIDVWQIFEVNTDGKIVYIKGSDSKPDDFDVPETEQEFLRLAARYYTAKDYDKAAETFIKLTEIYPDNAEGWYRLAMMVEYKRKWSNNRYHNPRQTAISYMREAYDRASGKLKKKAKNVLYYWEHPNYM